MSRNWILALLSAAIWLSAFGWYFIGSARLARWLGSAWAWASRGLPGRNSAS